MTTAQREPPRLISQSELARILNVPSARLAKAIVAGKVRRDAVMLKGRLNVFDLARLEEIRRAIREAEILA